MSNSSSGSDLIIGLNSFNPLFIAPSDNPSYILVSNIFNGVGFTAWKRSLTISLSTKNKLKFIDGSLPQPSISSPEYSDWYCANSMVISWILNSLHKNIAESVLFLQTARDIWKELNQRYEQADGTHIYQIQQQLYYINQGSDDLATYFTKLAQVWDEL